MLTLVLSLKHLYLVRMGQAVPPVSSMRHSRFVPEFTTLLATHQHCRGSLIENNAAPLSQHDSDTVCAADKGRQGIVILALTSIV